RYRICILHGCGCTSGSSRSIQMGSARSAVELCAGPERSRRSPDKRSRSRTGHCIGGEVGNEGRPTKVCPAELRLGIFYLLGIGVERDQTAAVRWIRKTVKQGIRSGRVSPWQAL